MLTQVKHTSDLLLNVQPLQAAIHAALGDLTGFLASGRDGHGLDLAGGLVAAAAQLGVVAM